MTFLHILYAILSIHCLDTLDLGAGVEQPFDYLIVQNRQAVQSMLGRLMDWTVKDIMATVCSSFAPHSQTAEGAIPHLFSQQKKKRLTQVRRQLSRTQNVLGRVDSGVGDKSTAFRNVLQPLRIPLVIRPVHRTYMLLSDWMMSCCAEGANGCFDLRCRAFALGGQVSTEWSRCPGSMAWLARDSVAPLRRSSADWMPASIRRLSADVGSRRPATFARPRWWKGQWEMCVGTAAPNRSAVLLLLNGSGLK